jgi:hypothetical protein
VRASRCKERRRSHRRGAFTNPQQLGCRRGYAAASDPNRGQVDEDQSQTRQLRRRPVRPRRRADVDGVAAKQALVEHALAEGEVVVEDALAGVAAGRAGGFGLVIGIDRSGSVEELRAHGEDIVVGDLKEMLA